MKIYSVKSYYRWSVSGRVLSKLEERVVLFKARSFDGAIRKAEREAKKYSLEKFTNPFRQEVSISALEYFDAYEVYDSLESGCEIFSSSTLIEGKITDKKVLFKILDLDQKEIQKKEDILNMYFRNIEFNQVLNEKDYLIKSRMK
jgi:hypothetical protein